MASLLVIVGPGRHQVYGESSCAPMDIKETFASIMARMTRAKPEIEKRQADLLNEAAWRGCLPEPAFRVTLFGSQRALKSVEDFTEFEQGAASFDGDPVIATQKGVNILEDTVESFNLILGTQLSAQDTRDVVAFLRGL